MKKLVFGIYVLIGMIISLPIMIVLRILKKDEKLTPLFLSKYFRIMLKVLNVKVKIQGEITYPLGNTLVVSNHLSMLDIVLLTGYVKERMIFISKEENAKVPIISIWMKYNGVIFIPRDNLRESIKRLNKATNYMKNNIPVIIFPQGTRSKDINFKAGSLKFVQKSQGSILPIAIKGTDEILKNKSYSKNIVELTFNEIIPYEDYQNQNLVEVQTNIQELIKKEVNYE
ncbi:MAG: lysophospholipid acyltransferase family protein [Mycoplasmatales bacterium]